MDAATHDGFKTQNPPRHRPPQGPSARRPRRLELGAAPLVAPGLVANLIGARSAQHRFLFRARLTDGRTPGQAISDGDDFEVLRHLRAIASGNFP